MASQFEWTDAAVAILREMIAARKTYRQISRSFYEMNRESFPTRNACIGKALRIGLSEPMTPGNRASISRKRSAAGRKGGKASKAIGSFGDKPPRPLAPLINPDIGYAKAESRMDEVPPGYDITAPKKGIVEVGDKECRWPFNAPTGDEFHFCALPKTDGTSYCEFHARKAFQPLPRLRVEGGFVDLQRPQRERRSA